MIKLKNFLSNKNIPLYLSNNIIINIKRFHFNIPKNNLTKYFNTYSTHNFSEKINQPQKDNKNETNKSEYKYKNESIQENSTKIDESKKNFIIKLIKDSSQQANPNTSTTLEEEINQSKSQNFIMKFWLGFKKVWKQTFPSESDIDDIIQQRKEDAIKFKSELVDLDDATLDEVRIFIPKLID